MKPPPDDCSKPPSPLLKPGGGPRTVAFEKTVLVMVRSPTTLVRSADLARHLFSDPRIQVLFTVSEPRSVFSNELELAINKRGLPFVPWKNAVLETYDLALIESALDPLPEIKAPIIMLSHGVGHNSVRSVAGANTAHSNWLDEGPGTILPRIVGLVSEDEARVFGDRCQTEVLGDPVFDSMLQARHRRDEFRDALDIGDRKLVVLSSTWGRLSAFSARPQMFSELLSLLPADEFAIAAILHPNIWMGHGPWQIETWLRDALAGGLKLIPFESGWQATLVAADCLAGDHGSVSTYASMLGTPTCLLSYPEDALNGDLAIVQAMGSNKAVETAREIAEFAETTCRQASRGAQKRPNAAFSYVGSSMERLAVLAYRLIGLEPSSTAVLPLALEPPIPRTCKPLSFWVGFARTSDTVVDMRRTPSSVGPSGIRSDSTLLVASSAERNYRLVQSASCLVLENRDAAGWWQDASPFARCAYFQQGSSGQLSDRNGTQVPFKVPAHADRNVLAAILAYCLVQGDFRGTYRMGKTLYTVGESVIRCARIPESG